MYYTSGRKEHKVLQNIFVRVLENIQDIIEELLLTNPGTRTLIIASVTDICSQLGMLFVESYAPAVPEVGRYRWAVASGSTVDFVRLALLEIPKKVVTNL